MSSVWAIGRECPGGGYVNEVCLQAAFVESLDLDTTRAAEPMGDAALERR